MIKFTDLRVQKDHLVIAAEVEEIEHYFDNIYIAEIIIDTQDTLNTSGPSANSIHFPVDGDLKKFSLVLDSTDLRNLDINTNLFFVYARAKGTPAPNTPCGYDEEYAVGATFSMCPIYNLTLQYIKEVQNSCDIPRKFINAILQLKAVEYSINSKHFEQAAVFYKKFFTNTKDLGYTHNCGCHG